MIDSKTFSKEFKRMESWFKQTGLTAQHTQQIYRAVKWMTPTAWSGVVDELIEDRRPIQSAFPTIGEIKAAYGKYIKDNPQAAPPIDYDPEEDHRFPVSKMWGGFHLLEKTGNIADFNRYADRVRMPQRDRDRIIAKWNSCYSHNVTVNEDFTLNVAGPS